VTPRTDPWHPTPAAPALGAGRRALRKSHKEGAVPRDPGFGYQERGIAALPEHSTEALQRGPKGLLVDPGGRRSAGFTVQPTFESLLFDSFRQGVSMPPMIHMGVDDHRTPCCTVQEGELVLAGEVVEDAKTQDEVIGCQVVLPDILLDPGDARVLRPAFGARIDGRHAPAHVSTLLGEEPVTCSQVDEVPGGKQPQQLFKTLQSIWWITHRASHGQTVGVPSSPVKLGRPTRPGQQGRSRAAGHEWLEGNSR
jgi:hypothetical protein